MVSKYGQTMLGGPHDQMIIDDVASRWQVNESDGRHPGIRSAQLTRIAHRFFPGRQAT